MAIHLVINAGVLVAFVVSQAISAVWLNDAMPWGRYEERYLIPALCADFALAIMINYIICQHWSVRKWQDALWLAIAVTALYASLTAAHTVVGPKSLIALAFSSLHKFVIVLAMTLTMFLMRKQGL